LLPGVESVRRDVDTVDDLREALKLGVGAHTSRLKGAFQEGGQRLPTAGRAEHWSSGRTSLGADRS
jgi:2-phospho-L-lactate guanylyltransferase